MPDAPLPLRRVIFLNRFAWPEEPATAQLLADLSEALAAAGHEVTVIASRPGGSPLARRQTHHGVTLLRVTTTRWARLGLAGKAADFLTFQLGALAKLAFTVQRGDTVVALTDPPLLGIGAWLTARLCGARIFHWVQDVYPEIAAVVTGHVSLQVVNPLRDLAWRRSDGCVTLGSDLAATLLKAGVPADKISVSPNWAPAGLTVQPREAGDSYRARWQLAGKFVVAYSGNLGRVHDLEPVLEVADALREATDIAFVFLGNGAQRRRLEDQAARRGLANVRFLAAQPRAHLGESLAVGDLHLVTLLPGCEWLVFPSKLYGVTAIGRPVIFIGPRDCEIARLVTERGLGRSFARDEVASMAAAIRQLAANAGQLKQLRDAATVFGRENSGPARAVADWERLLARAG